MTRPAAASRNPSGGSGMFEEADIRARDAEGDAKPATQPGSAKATEPKKPSRSHFDRLFGLAKAGDWEAVRDYKVTGSNSYSKMVARYRQDLLALHAAADAAQ